MTLGSLLARLETEAEAVTAVEALGDIVLYRQVEEAGIRFNESPGEYVAGAAARYAAAAKDEEWMSLIAAIQREPDVGTAALRRILRWALARDHDDKECGNEPHTCAQSLREG